MEYDCLIIGYNDYSFEKYVNMVKSMGMNHPDYRDLRLNYITYKGKPYTALGILDKFYYDENKNEKYRPFHNADVLWNGLMYLGSYLHRYNFTFDYINLFQFEKENLKEKLLNNSYLSIAVMTTIYTYVDPIIEVISYIKKYNDDSKIIVGGPFISNRIDLMDANQFKSILNYINADFYVFSREGEQGLIKILHCLKSNNDFNGIENIVFKNKNDYIYTKAVPESNSLEKNMINYSLFTEDKIGDIVNVRISKGCPFKCSYCGFPLRSSKYQYLPIEAIESELDSIKSVNAVESIFFIDDSINVPLKRFKEMLKLMIRKKYNFKWSCFFRCDFCDDETVELMKDSGCIGVFLGLETTDDNMLKNMNKSSRLRHFDLFMPKFIKNNISIFLSIFIGFPGETYSTFSNTINYLRNSGADFYRPQLWFCDPNTSIWQKRDDFGLKGINFSWSHDTMNSKEACDLLDEAFNSIKDPVWLPDPGCNATSIYYLIQRGMSINMQKEFFKNFNAIVTERLINPDISDASPHLIYRLKKASKYNSSINDHESIENNDSIKNLISKSFNFEEV